MKSLRVVVAVSVVSIALAAVAGAAFRSKADKADVLSKAGRVETLAVDGDRYKVEWLAREGFDKTWVCRWAVEGDCEVKAEDGKLWVKGIRVGKINSATIWYRPELPADLVVRFKARVLPPKEDNAANLNLILNAREVNGGAVVFGRSGAYADYHKIPNYIITLTGGTQPGWSRVRRNPGFQMLHEADVRSEVGKEYQVVVTVQKGRLRYYLNGRKYHDVKDPAPLPGGKFAIRTWSTSAWWSDLEFGRVLPTAK